MSMANIAIVCGQELWPRMILSTIPTHLRSPNDMVHTLTEYCQLLITGYCMNSTNCGTLRYWDLSRASICLYV